MTWLVCGKNTRVEWFQHWNFPQFEKALGRDWSEERMVLWTAGDIVWILGIRCKAGRARLGSARHASGMTLLEEWRPLAFRATPSCLFMNDGSWMRRRYWLDERFLPKGVRTHE